jgi:hypothetical protein
MVFGHRTPDRPKYHLRTLCAPVEQANQLRIMSAVVGHHEPLELFFARQPRPRPYAQQVFEVAEIVVLGLPTDLVEPLKVAGQSESGTGLVGRRLV